MVIKRGLLIVLGIGFVNCDLSADYQSKKQTITTNLEECPKMEATLHHFGYELKCNETHSFWHYKGSDLDYLLWGNIEYFDYGPDGNVDFVQNAPNLDINVANEEYNNILHELDKYEFHRQWENGF